MLITCLLKQNFNVFMTQTHKGLCHSSLPSKQFNISNLERCVKTKVKSSKQGTSPVLMNPAVCVEGREPLIYREDDSFQIRILRGAGDKYVF